MRIFVICSDKLTDLEAVNYGSRAVMKYLRETEDEGWMNEGEVIYYRYPAKEMKLHEHFGWTLGNLVFHYIPNYNWYVEGKLVAYCFADCDVNNEKCYDPMYTDNWEHDRDYLYNELGKLKRIC